MLAVVYHTNDWAKEEGEMLCFSYDKKKKKSYTWKNWTGYNQSTRAKP